jgi:drug/metabolite transporter (DMT)-like permease
MFLLFTAMLAVSTSPIIARYLDDVPAVAISFWRMGFGALILWMISVVKKQSPLSSENRNKTIIAGIFLGIHFALFFGAIKLTTIANATFLGTLAPLFTYFIEKFILKRRHRPVLLMGLGLAITGAMIIVGNQFDFSSDFTLGNLLAIACSLFLGMAFIISEDIRRTVGTISYSRTLFLTAAVTLLAIAFFTNSPLTGFSHNEYGGLLLLGIIPTLIGHGSMYFAVRYVSPTVVASTPMGEPILASVIAWFLFQEAIGYPTLIGGGCTLLGLFVIAREK